AGNEPTVGEQTREVQGKDWRFRQFARFGAGATTGINGKREPVFVARAIERSFDRDRTRAGIEREVERPQHERAVDARGRANRRRRILAEEQHLEAAVLL